MTGLAWALVAYVAVMYGIALVARGQVHQAEDFLLAGRRLGPFLSTCTIFATWFGAGTLLTAAQEVREGGLSRAALDPVGAGLCLVLVGLFYAGPLHRMKIYTLPDFFGRRFGDATEKAASMALLPVYFGWVAAQFVALGHMLHVLLGLDVQAAIALVAAVGTGYTLLGGMWSVTLTDAVQVVLLLLGLLLLCGVAAFTLGDGSVGAGLRRFFQDVDPEKLRFVPLESAAFAAWTSALASGAFGNIPGQDLMQRVFSARTETIARWACVAAGAGYLVAGSMPLFLALSVDLLGVQAEDSALVSVAAELLSPAALTAFSLVVMSAVLSTIDSALLSPATILAQNLVRGPGDLLKRSRAAVVFVACCAWGLAAWGSDAYTLLEASYEFGLVALLAPLTWGLLERRGGAASALSAMGAGFALWGIHGLLNWPVFLAPLLMPWGLGIPVGVAAALAGSLAYAVGRPKPED